MQTETAIAAADSQAGPGETTTGTGFLRRLTAPASETQVTLALAASLVMMALLLGALIWQQSIITEQRDLIRLLWSWRQ